MIVDDPDPLGRLEDILAGRKNLCVYDETLQQLPTIHFQCNHKMKLRMLVHFYVSHWRSMDCVYQTVLPDNGSYLTFW